LWDIKEELLMTLKHFLIFVTVALPPSADALTQPDISAIGDFRAFTGNWIDSAGAKTGRNGNLNMRFEELEIICSGYLNPYAKGWIVLSTPGDGLEIEEAYATIFNGLPLKTEMRIGQFLADFGKLNSSHAHAYPFVDRPLAHRVLFGGDGFKDQGVNMNWVLPTRFYSKLSVNVLKGVVVGEDEVTDDPMDGRNTHAPVLSVRLNGFWSLSANTNCDAGISGFSGRYKGSGANGTGDDILGYRNLYSQLAAIDGKCKIRRSDYSSLTLQGELILNRRDVFTDRFEKRANWGATAFADYRFRKRYNVGVAFDRSPGIYDNTDGDYEQNIPNARNNTATAAFDDKNSTNSVAIFSGFSLLDETTLFRLSVRWTNFDLSDSSRLVDPSITFKKCEFTLAIQMIFSLGPHKPHEF
jgi:hypothetical protein